MKKILKISLFIIVFCLLLILFSNSKVQAVVETVTTVQQLQEVMGATEHSTIDGTTLKITDNFTWNLTDDIDIKIPELIIDFNGKEIKIEKNSDAIIDIIEGKVIFKDSQGNIGGIYCKGHTIEVENSTELIIENGQYIAEITDGNNGVIQNKGGTITIENGIFKSMDYSEFFMLRNGKMTINNGDFEMNGILIDADDQHWAGDSNGTQLLIHGGTFSNETLMPLIRLNTRYNGLNAIIDGGLFKSDKGNAIHLSSSAWEDESASLILNGCIIETGSSCLQIQQNLEKFNINIQNCTLKCTFDGIGVSSAINAVYTERKEFEQQPSSMIKKYIKNYDKDTFWTFKNDGKGGISVNEYTYKELIFKDGKLISAIGIPNDKENNAENNVENNTDNNTENNMENNVDNNTDNNTENNANNNAENNTENNIENNVDNKAENVTKLPQTGEETNVFTQWLSIVIILGIIWLGSMLLIDREKKKMTKK